MADSKSEILQGTLDLMVLKTLDAMGPMHGYGIARRIEQISEDALAREPGHRLSVPHPAGAEGLDRRRVGHVGEQPPSEVLLALQSRPPAARRRDRATGNASPA